MGKKSLLQDQGLVRILLIVWVVSSACTLFLFSNVDRIIHHDMYSYGLQFNMAWAGPYWGIEAAIYICMIAPAGLSTCLLVYDFARNRNNKKRSNQQTLERSAYVRCSKCKKRFNQERAQVVLDFTQKPPKHIRVCPYCHAVLESFEEKDSDKIHIAEPEEVTPSTASGSKAQSLFKNRKVKCRSAPSDDWRLQR